MRWGTWLSEAWHCETCRRYRQGVVVLAALLLITWALG